MEFRQQEVDEHLVDDLEQLVRLAVREDLGRTFDLTTVAVVQEGLPAVAKVVSREPGVAAGLDLLPKIAACLQVDFEFQFHKHDGERFDAGCQLVELHGDARDVLTCERIFLNFLGRLCGVATWTDAHVTQILGTGAKLYDTRKTTPGWRRLEKYAVRCGGGTNHRGGLNEAIMIKDNHLACHERITGSLLDAEKAVNLAREFIASLPPEDASVIVEIEVDNLDQLASALRARPDIILLDNMNVTQLKQAVSLRDSEAPGVELEASGGVKLDTLREIALTGVERISVGALTHSAVNLDLGLDWQLGLSES